MRCDQNSRLHISLRRYLVRLANQNKINPKQTLPLMIEFRKEVDKFGTVVKNFRITDVAIEFDLYATDKASKDKALAELSKDYGAVLLDRDLSQEETSFSALYQDKQDTVKQSIDLFNEQRFWECHEALEQIWRREKDPTEKAVQQGVILAASAFVHAQRDEDAICLGMIPRALAKLNQYKEENYYGLKVAKLKKSLEEIEKSRKIVYPKL
jgi:uncharacterized protein